LNDVTELGGELRLSFAFYVKQFILMYELLFPGGKGPISFSLVSDYGPPPCAPDQPFPPTPKDKLEPATPSVYVRMCSFLTFLHTAELAAYDNFPRFI